MLSRIAIAAVFSLSLSTAASANCFCHNSGAYNITQMHGVTLMRGNMPSIINPNNRQIASRKAAEARADKAERNERIAKRDAAKANAELASRPKSTQRVSYRSQTGNYRPRYNSGNYGFGASISSRGGRGRIRGGNAGGRGGSGAIFSGG